MTTTSPKFETPSRHSVLGFVVIASICISLAVGFFVTVSQSRHSTELRASTAAASVQHAA